MEKTWQPYRSRSLRARGLKLLRMPCPIPYAESRSLRARGLKLVDFGQWTMDYMSRSLRARGLKHKKPPCRMTTRTVALFTGAWIETGSGERGCSGKGSRALYGRVD